MAPSEFGYQHLKEICAFYVVTVVHAPHNIRSGRYTKVAIHPKYFDSTFDLILKGHITSMTIMKIFSLQALALLGVARAKNDTRGAAMMRFACSQLTVERLDPGVNPDLIGSPHTHQTVRGNSFTAEMKTGEHDLIAKSTCTSCTFNEDFR
jgi:hypothetical protein